MDRNDRTLTNVLRERSQHRGEGAGRPPRIVVAAVLIVVAVAIGFELTTMRRGALESSGGAVLEASTPSVPAAAVQPAAGRGAPGVADSGAGGAQAAAAQTPSGLASAGRGTRYVVQPGDSLQMIAARNHLNPATLVSVNELEDPDILQPGLELIIPSTDGFLHIVEPGETLRSIADKYGIDTAALIDANALSAPDNITVGLRLFIPQDQN